MVGIESTSYPIPSQALKHAPHPHYPKDGVCLVKYAGRGNSNVVKQYRVVRTGYRDGEAKVFRCTPIGDEEGLERVASLTPSGIGVVSRAYTHTHAYKVYVEAISADSVF